MKRRLLVAALAGVLGLTVAWLWWQTGSGGRVAAGSAGPAPSAAVATVVDPTAYSRLHALGTGPRDDLRIVGAVLRNYLQSVAGPDAPPLGFNEEIVRALGGANPLRLVFLPPDHPAIDARGRLCDRWGTPYFFHPLAATNIEVRTAGPDRRLFTADDLSAASVDE
ncbi:MAG: hypothetical protein IPL39_12535 [Opitutaceae bacterium]|nr:hypothetical protein [Opitutaceae bacterium]